MSEFLNETKLSVNSAPQPPTVNFDTSKALKVVRGLWVSSEMKIVATKLDSSLFKYKGFDGYKLLVDISTSISAEHGVTLGIIAATIGRITQKKLDNHPILKSNTTIQIGNSTFPLSKLFDGSVSTIQVGQTVCSVPQLLNGCLSVWFISVLDSTVVKDYMKQSKQPYAHPDHISSFDFAGNIPLSDEAFCAHMATRYIRSLTLKNYISPDFNVSLNQLSAARMFHGTPSPVPKFEEVQECFTNLVRGFKLNYLINFPLSALTSSSKGERNMTVVASQRSLSLQKEHLARANEISMPVIKQMENQRLLLEEEQVQDEEEANQ